MKNIIVSMVLSAVIVPVFAFAQNGTIAAKSTESSNVKLFAVPPQKGQKSDAVRDLQRMLATDPAIYPKGMVTGYFGVATEAAVKKLQVHYGLPATGVVDEATQSIFVPPQIRLTVLTPNGGETWDSTLTRTIQWATYTGPVVYGSKQIFPSSDSEGRAMRSAPSVAGDAHIFPEPFFGRVSIDLVRDSNPGYVYHIGTAEMYQSFFTWALPSDVPAGNDFRIRISVGGEVPCYWARDAHMPMENRVCSMYYPTYSASDTSDGTFTISGSVTPDPQVIAKLKAQVSEMEATLNMLLRQLQAMKEVLARL